ncbi:MAG: hypothetical protein ACI8SA_001672 [Dokdonia sp.]|jgi:hypothetical protein
MKLVKVIWLILLIPLQSNGQHDTVSLDFGNPNATLFNQNFSDTINPFSDQAVYQVDSSLYNGVIIIKNSRNIADTLTNCYLASFNFHNGLASNYTTQEFSVDLRTNDTTRYNKWVINKGDSFESRLGYHINDYFITDSIYISHTTNQIIESIFRFDSTGKVIWFSEEINGKLNGKSHNYLNDSTIFQLEFKTDNLVDIHNENIIYVDNEGQVIDKETFFQTLYTEDFFNWRYSEFTLNEINSTGVNMIFVYLRGNKPKINYQIPRQRKKVISKYFKLSTTKPKLH